MRDRVLKERYAIETQLGHNAGRRTLLARDLHTQELVAIKLLTFDPDFQWDALKLFEREAETLQSLSHPAIPRYLDHFEFQTPTAKGFALVQSYIEAKSLAEWVELEREFSEQEIEELAQALLEILIYLHKQSPPVIHRDIKPSNILLGARSGHSVGQVYLVDFGSVQTLAATEGSTITVVGTYGYMPPEQFGGRAVPASDLYSLGATLIYLVTGTHPADLPQEDLRIQFEPKLPLNLAFIDWLHEMTDPDLKSRLSSSEQALEVLQEISEKQKLNPVIKKPENSNVKLKKDRDSIEIIIPSRFRKKNLFFDAICIVVFVLGSILLSIALSIFIWILYMILGLSLEFIQEVHPAIPVYITFLISLAFFSFLLRSTKLKIDREKIYLTRSLLGSFEYKIRPLGAQKHISKISLLQNKNRKILALDWERRTFSNINQIQIWAGARKYPISTKHLTNHEAAWIASELSAWLGLPIT